MHTEKRNAWFGYRFTAQNSVQWVIKHHSTHEIMITILTFSSEILAAISTGLYKSTVKKHFFGSAPLLTRKPSAAGVLQHRIRRNWSCYVIVSSVTLSRVHGLDACFARYIFRLFLPLSLLKPPSNLILFWLSARYVYGKAFIQWLKIKFLSYKRTVMKIGKEVYGQ